MVVYWDYILSVLWCFECVCESAWEWEHKFNDVYVFFVSDRTLSVPWPYPCKTRPKHSFTFNYCTLILSVNHKIPNDSFYQTISGVHNNNVQGVDTHLLFRFLHFQKIGFKTPFPISWNDFKVKIPWKLEPQSLYNYGTTTKYRNTVKILGQKNNYLRFYPTLKFFCNQKPYIRYYVCLRHTVIQIEPTW